MHSSPVNLVALRYHAGTAGRAAKIDAQKVRCELTRSRVTACDYHHRPIERQHDPLMVFFSQWHLSGGEECIHCKLPELTRSRSPELTRSLTSRCDRLRLNAVERVANWRFLCAKWRCFYAKKSL
jgi:hypothetical protein